jgi:hypothetical protein
MRLTFKTLQSEVELRLLIIEFDETECRNRTFEAFAEWAFANKQILVIPGRYKALYYQIQRESGDDGAGRGNPPAVPTHTQAASAPKTPGIGHFGGAPPKSVNDSAVNLPLLRMRNLKVAVGGFLVSGECGDGSFRAFLAWAGKDHRVSGCDNSQFADAYQLIYDELTMR